MFRVARRYLSLATGVFWLLHALTGMTLVFHRELVVSQLRAKTNSKPAKDLRQAATLIAALVERFPGAVEDALTAVPKSAGRHVRRAAAALARYLPASAETAWEALKSYA